MDKDTIRQVFILTISAIVLYFSGTYLMSIGSLKNLFDGLVIMFFFFAVFPFLSISALLIIKLFKNIFSLKSY
jgi:hypothetical protein